MDLLFFQHTHDTKETLNIMTTRGGKKASTKQNVEKNNRKLIFFDQIRSNPERVARSCFPTKCRRPTETSSPSKLNTSKRKPSVGQARRRGCRWCARHRCRRPCRGPSSSTSCRRTRASGLRVGTRPVAAPPVVPLLRRQSRLDGQLHRQAIRTAGLRVRAQQVPLQMERSKKVNPDEERQKLVHRCRRRRRLRFRRLRRRRFLIPVCCRIPILFLLLKNASGRCWDTESGLDRGPGFEPTADEAAGIGVFLEVGVGPGHRVRGERGEHGDLLFLDFDVQIGWHDAAADVVVVVVANAQLLVLGRLVDKNRIFSLS